MSKTRSDWKRPVLAGIAIAVVFLMIASYGISDFGISQVSVSGGKYKPDALPAGSYYVNFTETGLQVGTTWQLSYGTSISFLSNTVYSTNSVISFTETNGTIYFAALEADNPQYSYVPNISSGSIVIDGNNVFVNVFFTNTTTTPAPSYHENFNITNLPSFFNGVVWEWDVSVVGVSSSYNQKVQSTGTSMSFSGLETGTYDYSVSSAFGTSLSPGSGALSVSANGTVNLKFSFDKLYPVTFKENGLPGKQTFSVGARSIQFGQCYQNTSFPGDNYLTFKLPNGSYSFYAGTSGNYRPNPTYGSFIVNGSSLTVAVKYSFAPTTYDASFTIVNPPAVLNESSLSYGIELETPTGGFIHNYFSDSLPTVTVTGLSNGTYLYHSSSCIQNYYLSPSLGEFTVSGANVSVALTIHTNPKTYSANFTITDIQKGVPDWGIMLMNSTKELEHSFVCNPETSFSRLSPGIYTYSLAAYDGYLFENQTGTINITDANVNVNLQVTLQKSYPIYFSESGLPSGVQWGVVPTFGVPFSSKVVSTCCLDLSSVSSPLEFPLYLANGTYQFQTFVYSLGAYTFSAPFTLTVNGHSQNATSNFAPPTTGNNNGALALDAGIAAAVIVAAGLGITYMYRKKIFPPKKE